MDRIGRRALPSLVSLLLVGGLVGCGQQEGDPVVPGNSTPPAAPTPTAGSGPSMPATPSTTSRAAPPPPPPAPPISYGPGAGPESAPEPASPPAAPVPAPTADGPLNDQALPRQIAGFSAVPAEPREGEFHPNGSWVHAVPAGEAAAQALPRCGPDAGRAAPVARHALAGQYSASGATGNGLALQFADDRAAADWYGEFVRQLKSCSTDLATGPTGFSDHRQIDGGTGQVAEAGRLRGNRVLLVALNSGGGAGGPDPARLGRELADFTG